MVALVAARAYYIYIGVMTHDDPNGLEALEGNRFSMLEFFLFLPGFAHCQ